MRHKKRQPSNNHYSILKTQQFNLGTGYLCSWGTRSDSRVSQHPLRADEGGRLSGERRGQTKKRPKVSC